MIYYIRSSSVLKTTNECHSLREYVYIVCMYNAYCNNTVNCETSNLYKTGVYGKCREKKIIFEG